MSVPGENVPQAAEVPTNLQFGSMSREDVQRVQNWLELPNSVEEAPITFAFWSEMFRHATALDAIKERIDEATDRIEAAEEEPGE